MKVVIASNNKGKIAEIKAILGNVFEHIYSLADIGLNINVIEDGKTFEQNSYKKAHEVMIATGLPSLADDGGLEVEALAGMPGVYSARYAGENANDNDNNTLLLNNLADVPDEKRGARFVCCITLCLPDGRIYKAHGSAQGYILHRTRGKGGFGYDPLFFVPEYNATFAELTLDIKNSISHRYKALQALYEQIKELK